MRGALLRRRIDPAACSAVHAVHAQCIVSQILSHNPWKRWYKVTGSIDMEASSCCRQQDGPGPDP